MNGLVKFLMIEATSEHGKRKSEIVGEDRDISGERGRESWDCNS